MVQQLGAGSRVQVLQLLHWDLWLNVNDAEDEGRVLNLKIRQDKERRNLNSAHLLNTALWMCLISPD